MQDDCEPTPHVPPTYYVGQGRIERLGCPFAHAACAGIHISPLSCHRLVAWMCGMTGCACRCLFIEQDDPQWDHIRRSVQLQAAGVIPTIPCPPTVPLIVSGAVRKRHRTS